MLGRPEDGTYWRGRKQKVVKGGTPNHPVGTMPEFTHDFPEDFVLVIDTREPTNGLFMPKPHKGLIIVRDKLDTGDYSIRGFESKIAIERKEISDLIHCCGEDRKRFQDQLDRLRGLERKWLLIEGTEEEALSFQPYTQLQPNHIRGALTSIEVRYNIPIHYSRTRKLAERWVLDILIKQFQIKREGSK